MKKAPSVEVMPDIPDENSKEFNDMVKKHKKYIKPALIKKGGGVTEEVELDEVAPPGDKYERMVKHIKKNYPKDKEGIAYATAWKHKNKNK